VPTFKNCEIELWVSFEKETVLIDNIFVEPLNMLKSAVKQDLKKIGSSTQHQKVTKLENNDKFYFSATEKISTTSMRKQVSMKTSSPTQHQKVTKLENNDNFQFSTTAITTASVMSTSAEEKAGVLVAVIFVVLCVMITAVCIFHYCKISPLKNFNRNKTQEQENIMLMPIDKFENNVTIQINAFESYLKKTMLSTNNLENQFHVSGFT
jgi:hypothetical protein